jgi:hypothetical protein
MVCVCVCVCVCEGGREWVCTECVSKWAEGESPTPQSTAHSPLTPARHSSDLEQSHLLEHRPLASSSLVWAGAIVREFMARPIVYACVCVSVPGISDERDSDL